MITKLSLFIFLCVVSTARAQYYSWSTGVKPTLVIRTQFSNIPSTLDYETASTQMDLVSTRLANTSYGKTSLNSTITTRLYRLPIELLITLTYRNGGHATQLLETLSL